MLLALSSHRASEAVAVAGCAVVQLLGLSAYEDYLSLPASAAPAVLAVLAVLQAHPGSAGVALHASHALSTLASGSSGGSAACMQAGAPSALLAALQAHTADAGCGAEVTAHCCNALYSLRWNHGLSLSGLPGAMPAIVRALQLHAHSGSERLLLRLLSVLSEPLHRATAPASLLPAVLQVLTASLAAGALQVASAACSVLECCVAAQLPGLAEAAPALVVAAAMAALPGSSPGGRLLSRLACGSPAGLAACLAAGGVPALVAALQAQPGLRLSRSALQALCLLCAEHPQASLSAGAPAALLQALRDRLDPHQRKAVSAAEVLACCQALGSLAGSEGGQAACLQAGAAALLSDLHFDIWDGTLQIEEAASAGIADSIEAALSRLGCTVLGAPL